MIFRILLLFLFLNVTFIGNTQNEIQKLVNDAISNAKECNNSAAIASLKAAMQSAGLAYTKENIKKSKNFISANDIIINEKKRCDKIVSDRANQEANRQKNQTRHDELSEEAEGHYSYGDYDIAIQKASSAKKLISEGSASELLRRWRNTFIAEGKSFKADGNLQDALKSYTYAELIEYDYEVSNNISEIKNLIRKQEQNRSQYEELVKQANKEFKLENFDQCLSKLESADDYISLQTTEINLKRRANLGKNLKNGNALFASQKYAEAITAYEAALKYATQSDEQALVKGKIKAADYEMKVQKARSYFNDKNYERTIEILKEVRENNDLKTEDASLLQKALIAYDDQSFQKAKDIGTTDSYEKYLSKFPKGGHVSEANEFLKIRYEKDGDDYLKGHWYDNAVANYEKAKKYSNDDSSLEKKIKKANRWKNSLESGLTFDFAVPLGLNATTVETEDNYNYNYYLQSGIPVNEFGIGHQKIAGLSPITPLNVSANYALKLKIPSVKPMIINFGLKYSSNQGSNLSKVTPVSYEIYEGIYEPTNQAITAVDTNSFYFTNAYKFSQVQFKVGIQPFSFLEVYVPVNKMTLRYQNDYDCLDCDNDDIEIGNTISVGLGIKLGYKFYNGLFFSGFAENWNTAFNSVTSNNELIDPSKQAKSGFFSFNPFSSSKGLSIGFPITDYFDLYFSYINNNIRGDYRATPTNLTSLRSFNQHIFSVNFKYTIF